MTQQISFIARAQRVGRTATGVALALATVAAVTTLPAQQAPDSRWQPFIGCWTPDAMSTAIGANAQTQSSMVCIVPVSNSQSVDIATISDSRVQHTERVTANGVQIARTIDNCPGWESAAWSKDGNRVFLNSNFACGNNVLVKGSGLLALSADGKFVQVQGTTVSGNAGARVVRYNLADVMLADGSSLKDSAEVTTVPAQAGFALQATRAAAGTAPTAEAILDLSKHVDTQVAQAWVTELGTTTQLSAKELVALSDAGLPPALSDLMIAMQYPERFRLQRAPDATPSREVRTNDGGLTASRLAQCDYYDGFMSAYDAYNCFGRYGYGYGAYGAAPFGLMSNGRYGYNGFGYGSGYGYNNYGNYYYGSQPIIIIKNGAGETPAEPRGRAVKGGGYTRSNGTTTTTPRTTVSNPATGSGSGSTTGAAAGEGAASGGSTGRTAKPRTPPPGK